MTVAEPQALGRAGHTWQIETWTSSIEPPPKCKHEARALVADENAPLPMVRQQMLPADNPLLSFARSYWATVRASPHTHATGSIHLLGAQMVLCISEARRRAVQECPCPGCTASFLAGAAHCWWKARSQKHGWAGVYDAGSWEVTRKQVGQELTEELV
eukprot:scaffold11521_cov20-Tisochrysis_lutea.AAC.1